MTRVAYKVVCLLMVVAVACGCQSEEKSNSDINRNLSMDIKELKERALSRNWDALDIVDTAAKPQEAIPTLKDLAGNVDPEVREIALNCLAMIQDASVPGLLAVALSDEDDDIRAFALQALQTSYDESISDALIINLDNVDGDIRSGAALLLGRIGLPLAAEPISKRLVDETDESVKRNLKLALARLGDTDMKEEFASQFDIPDSEVRLGALEDMRYIGDRNLAPRILPALNDLGPAHLIAPKAEPEPERARVCDAAVNVIAELCDQPFKFKVDEFKVYSDEELGAAKDYLMSLKAE